MEEVVHVSEEKERVANYRAVFVTEISDSLHIYAQDVETGESGSHKPKTRGVSSKSTLGETS